MKICIKCKKEKSLDNFNKYRNDCKECKAIYNKLDYQKNKARYAEHSKQYRINNKERIAFLNKKWKEENPERLKELQRKSSKSDTSRNRTLLKKYGITLNQYNDMLSTQEFSCAICKKHQSHFKRRLAVDHNHSSGKVRGLLCSHCNQHRVGMLNLEWAQKVFEYLKKYDG